MNQQHTQPCKDCPWRRKAFPGWLGGHSIQYWLMAAHSDVVIRCHTATEHQCAGMSIYRANVCKSARPPLLELPANKEKVFDSALQFTQYHSRQKVRKVPPILPFGMTPETAKAL